ncbi:HTH-type transcriptional repressor CsiR [Aquimixticola soesokkakensis]|uniref:HTH-type transcriptional repressor CsiR n=1 Tax=Aquimixticola soesokkakensis TaxID=1519096 RepID=A0A1Y5S6A7_9RHOB|nr:GntR family transcriptional regulator [Aquimixticola soesokkakensis]SLN32952.1 HTH-type transcriptional repressor CsiR [Aquimixticola soesokkakensis]
METPRVMQEPASEGRKPTLSSRLAAELREAILDGDLKPGSKVNLDQLRRQYDVSLSPMREAVSRLVPDGLVKFEDQRGYTITPISVDDLREVTLLRADLETAALGHSIERAGVDWEGEALAALHRVTRLKRDASDRQSIRIWEEAHTKFHIALGAGCAMPHLLHMCEVLHNLNERYRRILDTSSQRAEGAAREHTEICQAAVDRDKTRAMSLLRTHITLTGTILAAEMETSARFQG